MQMTTEKQAAPVVRQKNKSKQFVPVSFDLLDNPNFRNHFMTKKKFRTYLWLRRRIIRSMFFKDYHPDPANSFRLCFTDRLGTAIPLSELAKTLNISKSTAGDHIQQLADDGVIKIETVPASLSDDGREHHLYILGTRQDGEEHWFIDDVFSNPSEEVPR
jgi:DNA-binding MarR family transcriptional regulator